MFEIKNKKFWFVTKRYGFGWRPSSWQGWVSTLIYVVAIIFVVSGGKEDPELSENSWFVMQQVISLTALLIVLCYVTGEKPRWRWGKDK